MKQSIYLGLVLAVAPILSAQTANLTASEVRKVEVVPTPTEIRVEVTLSAPVSASVEVAQHPDRIVLKLPDTTAQARQKRISVQKFGVRAVRFALNQPNPPTTHLVVDLDREHTYKILTDGPRITLVVEAPLSFATARRTPPAAAASRPLINSLGRNGGYSSGQPGSQTNPEAVLLTPPPSGAPISFPGASSPETAEPAVAARSNPPSARRPNTASLQQGTVFPSADVPGAGIVPPVSNMPRPSGLDERNTQVSTNTPTQPGSSGNQALLQESKLPSGSPEAARPGPDPSVASPPPSGQVAAVQSANSAGASQMIAGTSGPRTELAPQPTNSAPEPTTTHSAPSPLSTEMPAAQNASTMRAADSRADASPAPALTGQPETRDAASTQIPFTTAAAEQAGSGQGETNILLSSIGANTGLRTAFRVKYVAQDAAYLDGGRASGLVEGMKLTVRDLPKSGAAASVSFDPDGEVAELEVLSVAETSSVTEVHQPKRPVKVGDLAYLSSADQLALVEKNALSATRKYPAVVSFTENDTLDDEARTEVPKPPLPSVNRARGRIGVDYIGTANHDSSGLQSTNLGLVLRADITRLNGTYWNVSGYWRGRLNKSTGSQQTLQDLINRTYHLYTSYDNPNSAWVAGFGRMYLPWATSLDTIDGGYIGRKLSHGATTGVFLGSTPDPTSYSYAPNHEVGGAFVNFEGGSYDDLHYTSTTGGGVKLNRWSIDRPFAFVENGIFYKRIFSIYQAAQLDDSPGYYYQTNTNPPTTAFQPGTGFGVGRSFLTFRVQPHPRVEFSFNHTYFRDLPTFDPNLIGTGMLDKYLFQGFSAGTRVEVYKRVWLSADLGLSNRTGDEKKSLNQMFGITFGRLPWVGLRADARYSRFNSSFGSGSYEALTFSKNLGETLQLHVLLGQQDFASSLTSATKSRFVNGQVETALGRNYFMQAGGTINRGSQMNYDQWLFTFGYRFDNRHGHKGE